MNYKAKMAIPLIILLFSVGYFVMIMGNLSLDIDLKGGTQISFESSKPVEASSIESVLSDYSPHVRTARGISGYTVIIEVDADTNTTPLIEDLRNSGYELESLSSQTIGPALGEAFFSQAQLALLFAFAFMALVIFIIFKQPLPSIYMVLVAVADIIEALVFSQLLGINLSLATFAALLLLVGYSVDSDVLLTTRVLKTREDEPKVRVKNALKTGLTMTGTTIGVVSVLYISTTSVVLQQIAAVLLIGLVFDLPNTWFFNAPLLRWWVEKKERVNE